MITITTVAAIMGTIVGSVTLGEKALHSRSKIKAFLDTGDQPLLLDLGTVSSLNERDREIVEGVYRILEKSTPIAKSILRRIYKRYLTIVFLVLLVAIAACLFLIWILGVLGRVILTLGNEWDLPVWLYLVLSVALPLILLLSLGYFIIRFQEPITRVLEDPVNLPLSAASGLPTIRGFDVSDFMSFSSRIVDNQLALLRDSMALSGAGSISVSERSFLNQYVRLRTMLSCFESYFLSQTLESFTGAFYEPIAVGIAEDAARIIRHLADTGRLVEAKQEKIAEILEKEFAQAGIRDFLDPRTVSDLPLIELTKVEDDEVLERSIHERYLGQDVDQKALQPNSLLQIEPEASDREAPKEGIFGRPRAKLRRWYPGKGS